MFYCNKCADYFNYPISFFKSYGKCELCGKVNNCNDVPSSELPKSNTDNIEDKEVSNNAK